MQTILIASDLSAQSDRAMDRGLLVAGAMKATASVLHVIDNSLGEAAQARQRLLAERQIKAQLAQRTTGSEVALTITVGDPVKEIVKAAEAAAASLIVLGEHRSDPPLGIPPKAMGFALLRESPLPVLMVHDPVLTSYRRLMVAFDFSGWSEAALRLALTMGATDVIVVHAFQSPFPGMLDSHDTIKALRDEAQANLAAAVARITNGLGALPTIRQEVIDGEAIQTIHGAAESFDVDLLLLGTHGRSGLAHAFYGSVAESILRHPPCDIVAIRCAPSGT